MPAKKKSNAQIKREVDAILAMKPEMQDEAFWKSAEPWLSNWRVDTRATTDPAAAGSRWEAGGSFRDAE